MAELDHDDMLAPQTVQFGMIPRWLWSAAKGQHKAISMYGYLAAYYGGRGGIFPSQARIAADMDMSVREVKRATAVLREAGAVTVSRRRNEFGNLAGNVYKLAWDRPQGPPVAPGPDLQEHGIVAGGDQGPNTSPDQGPPVAPHNQTVPQGFTQTEKSPPSPVVTKAKDACAQAREEEDPQQQQTTGSADRAAQWLLTLEAPWTPSQQQAAALGPRLAQLAAERHWSAGPDLAAALTRNPGGINNHAAVLATRIENLPIRPKPAQPRACTECGTTKTTITGNGVCTNCVAGRGRQHTTASTDRMKELRAALHTTNHRQEQP